MAIIFGPAGLGGVNEAEENLKYYSELGLKACEIAFTYGVYIKNKKDAERIGKCAKDFGIQLSIHAPYYINLNSEDEKKVEKSKERILKCCEVGTWLGAKKVVFHPGFYGKKKSEESYEKIRNIILEIMDEIKEKKYTPEIAPETTGKVNVFGSLEDISRLVSDTECSFCIDFAHVLARYKTHNFEEVLEKFGRYKEWHVHFSGIEYGEKGEKNHIQTPEKEIKRLISNLPSEKRITIINESPSPVKDSLLGLTVYSRN